MNIITTTTTTDKFKLFQVPLFQEQIDKWFPLESTKCNRAAQNCGPTALALTNTLSRTTAEQYGYIVEKSGITVAEMNKLLMNEYPRLALQNSSIVPIVELMPFLEKELSYGNVTILFLYKRNNNENTVGHIVAVARSVDGSFALFEGQTNEIFAGMDLIHYLQNYTHFKYMLITNKNKRTIDELCSLLNRKSCLQTEPSSKKIRLGGRRKRKTVNKHKGKGKKTRKTKNKRRRG
jgi:beta-N-acetylglucosaminidase